MGVTGIGSLVAVRVVRVIRVARPGHSLEELARDRAAAEPRWPAGLGRGGTTDGVRALLLEEALETRAQKLKRASRARLDGLHWQLENARDLAVREVLL